MHTSLLAPIVLTPLVGAAILGLLGKRLSERLIGLIACSTIGISTVLAFYAFFGQLLPQPEETRLLTQHLFTWLQVGNFRADFAFMVDPLSGIMVLFVTFVAFWIHVFATGYMHGEEGFYRFFAYLNLFMFSMLTLILGDNLLMLFVGWEGVGLCSYLLIGYYFLKDFANDAAKKAFVVNRIGDLGFALGIMLVYQLFGTISFNPNSAGGSFLAKAAELPVDPFNFGLFFAGGLTCVAFLFFIGAIGKSAQIPLYVWLPDAMAGPTPVSALIHAATMVTAGVYMVARTSEIYAHAPAAMFLVAIVGAATALFAATIGIAQWDIKKVLAYSTVSQLGYMFLACGVGAWVAAIFHVFTHAFFKAQLFLGSGSVIHGMHHEQDMSRMGGLKKYMPITWATMMAGWLAIAGFPLLSGFFSKDEILFRTFSNSALPEPWGKVLWGIGALTALLTAIYMTRLMVLTFWGSERFRTAAGHHQAEPHHGQGEGAAEEAHTSSHGHGHALTPHESPKSMTIPLIVLAIGAIVVGWIGIAEGLTGSRIPNYFEHFLAPAVAKVRPYGAAPATHSAPEATAPTGAAPGAVDSHAPVGANHSAAAAGHGADHTLEIILTLVSVGIALLGLIVGWVWFKKNPLWQPPRLLENKYYVDEAYDAAVVEPLKATSTFFLWRIVDVRLIDGLVNGAGTLLRGSGGALRLLQTGATRSYAAVIGLAGVAVIGYFIYLALK